jgi:hypothetical protein
MDTIMFLESVVLSCSYMRYILSHMGRVVIPFHSPYPLFSGCSRDTIVQM